MDRKPASTSAHPWSHELSPFKSRGNLENAYAFHDKVSSGRKRLIQLCSVDERFIFSSRTVLRGSYTNTGLIGKLWPKRERSYLKNRPWSWRWPIGTVKKNFLISCVLGKCQIKYRSNETIASFHVERYPQFRKEKNSKKETYKRQAKQHSTKSCSWHLIFCCMRGSSRWGRIEDPPRFSRILPFFPAFGTMQESIMNMRYKNQPWRWQGSLLHECSSIFVERDVSGATHWKFCIGGNESGHDVTLKAN
jgi:hypothetical protein